jgi:hypothetical protein
VFIILLLASFKMAQHGFRVSAARGFAFQRWGVGRGVRLVPERGATWASR